VLSASFLGIELLCPLAIEQPTLRAAIETVLTLSALIAAGLFGSVFVQTRGLRDLLLFVALVEVALLDFWTYLVPVAIDLRTSRVLIAAPLVGKLVAGATMAAAALTPQDRRVLRRGSTLRLAAGWSILAVGLAMATGLLLDTLAKSGPQFQRLALAARHPIWISLALGAAALLVWAAVAVARDPGDRDSSVAAPLSCGLILLATAQLYYLAKPAPGVGSVVPQEGIRLLGIALILTAAILREAETWRALADDAVTQERRRVARDLHDGLAQDLAFIAVHGERMAQDEGRDHPLALAARRALAVSRGAIADLSASTAATTRDALRQLANELEARFEMRIVVEGTDPRLSLSEREDVVRITREAIANAAHAGAHHAIVSLTHRDGGLVLTVLDDGCGIDSTATARPGFGLRSMCERADALGGRLTAQEVRGGGTELKVVFP
jgi:signal transduction histidine kinase